MPMTTTNNGERLDADQIDEKRKVFKGLVQDNLTLIGYDQTAHAFITYNPHTGGLGLLVKKSDGVTTLLDVRDSGITIGGGLTVTGSISNAGGPVFNVQAYGADPTGVVAADGIIATTMAAMPAQGGVLYFPAGTYLVNSPIVINKAMTVMGDGSNLSYLMSSSATANVITVTTPTGGYNNFRDFGITKTAGGMPSTNGAGIAFALAAGTAASAPRFTRLWIGNQYQGLNLLNVAEPRVMECDFVECQQSGIRVHYDHSPWGGGDLIVRGCYFASTIIGSTAAIRINGGAGFLIAQNKFIGFGTQVLMDLVAGSSNLTDLFIIGNSMEGQPTTPVLINLVGLSNFASVLIEDNQMYANTGAAINVGTAGTWLSDVLIANNTIVCMATSIAMGFSGGTDIQIQGNKLTLAAGATGFANAAATNIRRGLNQVIGGTMQSGTWTHIEPKVQRGTIACTNTNAAYGTLFQSADNTITFPEAFRVAPTVLTAAPIVTGGITLLVTATTTTTATVRAIGNLTATPYTFMWSAMSDG